MHPRPSSRAIVYDGGLKVLVFLTIIAIPGLMQSELVRGFLLRRPCTLARWARLQRWVGGRGWGGVSVLVSRPTPPTYTLWLVGKNQSGLNYPGMISDGLRRIDG